MRSLEELTRDLFINYSMRKLGRKVDWNRLSYDRRIAWMDDTYGILKEILELVEDSIENKDPVKQPQASFEAGLLSGTQRENNRIKNTIKNMNDFYFKQLQDLVKDRRIDDDKNIDTSSSDTNILR